MTIIPSEPYALPLHEQQVCMVMMMLDDALLSEEAIDVFDLADLIVGKMHEMMVPEEEAEAVARPRVRVPAGCGFRCYPAGYSSRKPATIPINIRPL